MRYLPSVFCLALALFVARCGESADTSDVPGSVVGPTWRLAATGDGGEGPLPVATLAFDSEGRVSGTTDCNDFMGAYELAGGGALDFSGLATTRKACAPAAMAQEQRVLTALGAADRAEVSDGRLVLFGTGGGELMRFDRVAGSSTGESDDPAGDTVGGAPGGWVVEADESGARIGSVGGGLGRSRRLHTGVVRR